MNVLQPIASPTMEPIVGTTKATTPLPTMPTWDTTQVIIHDPTSSPTAGPTSGPTRAPTLEPTTNPVAGEDETDPPVVIATSSPTAGPTSGPTRAPTLEP